MLRGIFVLFSSLSVFCHAGEQPSGHSEYLDNIGDGCTLEEISRGQIAFPLCVPQFEDDEDNTTLSLFEYLYKDKVPTTSDEHSISGSPDSLSIQDEGSPQSAIGWCNLQDENFVRDVTNSVTIMEPTKITNCETEPNDGTGYPDLQCHPYKRLDCRAGRKDQTHNGTPSPLAFTEHKEPVHGDPHSSSTRAGRKGQIHDEIYSPLAFGCCNDGSDGIKHQPTKELLELCSGRMFKEGILSPNYSKELHQQSPIQGSPTMNSVTGSLIYRSNQLTSTVNRGLRFGERLFFGADFKIATIRPALRGSVDGTQYNLDENRLALEFTASVLRRGYFVVQLKGGHSPGSLKIASSEENFHTAVFALEGGFYRFASASTRGSQRVEIFPADIVIMSSWTLDLRKFTFASTTGLGSVVTHISRECPVSNPIIIAARVESRRNPPTRRSAIHSL